MRIPRFPLACCAVLALVVILWLFVNPAGDREVRLTVASNAESPRAGAAAPSEPSPSGGGREALAVAGGNVLTDVRADAAAAAPRVQPVLISAAAVPAVAHPADRYAASTVLEVRVIPDPKQPATRRRVRLIKSDFKYPLLRVEDRLVVNPATGEEKIVAQQAMVADHIVVKLKKGFAESDLIALMEPLGAKIRRKMPASGIYLIEFPLAGIDTVPQAVARFAGPAVAVAEPDFIVHADVLPNDARFSELWGMHNTGQTGGVADADIDAPEAWDVATTRGSLNVRVGVIDSGIDATHPDLMPNIWVNPGEIVGNGLDDDNNGFIDDTRGWDFVNNDNDPQDDNNHGTHCSGTIGGAGNNGAGVTGVCWNVSLVGLKFLNAAGSGSNSDAVEATAYATLIGVNLTSNSWGGGGYSQAMKDEIDQAHAAGILFVAAAGNDSADNDTTASYPSNYDSLNVIAVAATTHTDALSSFSSYGATQVDLGAPGSAILSSVAGGGYASFNGTSMATPHVAGACALLKSYRPGLSHVVIRELILASADPKPALAGKCVSGGRLNVHQALLLANDIAVTPVTTFVATGPSGGPYTPGSRTYTLTNNAATPQTWTVAKTQSWLDLSTTGGTLAAGASATVSATLNALAGPLPDGTYTDTLTFFNATSGRSVLREVRLLAGQPDYFTELFDSAVHDLDNQRFVFVPNSTTSGYTVSRAAVSAFNTSPVGGTTLSLADDTFAQVALTGGAQVALYGTAYATFYVGSNGYITFGAGDDGYAESLATHFARPRVAALFDDLLPSAASTISWRQLADRVAVTYENIAEYGTTNANSFQIELFFDGRIAITNLAIAATDGLIGLSRGQGVPANFLESDFSAYPVAQQFVVTLPATSTEGAGVLVWQGRVSVDPSPAAALTVTLASGNPAEVTVPGTVVIPAGAASALFDITVVDDVLVDGTQSATVTASAPAYLAGSSALLVNDNETATLGVVLPASTTEAVASVTGTVTMSPAAGRNVTVALTSSDITAAKVPLNVTILAGQTSASFQLTPENDPAIDGPQTAVITAQVTGWTAGAASIVVEDNEQKVLALVLPASLIEGAAGVTGQVTIPGSLAINLTVLLESSISSKIAVPASVQINAGQTQATFPLTVANNSIDDGSTAVTVGATATGFTAATRLVTVLDNDPNNFTISAVESPQIRNAPFAVTITARRADGMVMTDFTGPATLTGSGAGGAVVILSPTLTGFVSGVWTGLVTVATADTAVVLTVADAGGHTGSSNAFDVPAVGPLHHFTWAAVPSPQVPGVPIGVTVTARDRVENTVSAFIGTVAITGAVEAQPTAIGTGTGTISDYPLRTAAHDQRTQIIYTAAELGGAKPLTSLALDVSTLPGQTMNGFTIRLRPTSKSSFIGAGDAMWESTGWTTVHQSAASITATGWTTFPFSVPCLHDGTSNLMVDISFNNTSSTSAGAVRMTTAGTPRVMQSFSSSGQGDPLTWAGAVPAPTLSTSVPNVRFGTLGPVVVTPSGSENFAAGVWSGGVTVPQELSGLRLRASDGSGHDGFSNAFEVAHPAVVGVSPASLRFVLPVGGSTAQTLTITNRGLGVLQWALAVGVGGTATVAGGPVFASTAPPSIDKAKDFLAPAESRQFTPTRPATARGAAPVASAAGLAAVLASLDGGFASITNLIPNRYNFSDGITGTTIVDGGDDMYDNGNILNTNLSTNLPYTNGVVTSAAAFGVGGRYFTRKHPGLFVLAADIGGLNHFEITGNLGADGLGLTDTAVLTMARGGVSYKGFVKRVYSAGDPSVNHLIIVVDNGSVNHTASTDTNNDQHRVTALTGSTRIYYLLYAQAGGGYIDNPTTTNIMAAFLDVIGETDWARLAPGSGSVAAGGAQLVTVTASAQWRPIGIHPLSLILSSNDQATPQITIPLSLEIVAAGDGDGDLLPDFWEKRHGWSAGDGDPAHGRDGDLDRDGLSNWLEYLLDLNPALANAGAMPFQSTAINPADGLEYLTFTYRRRTDVSGVTYAVQVSTGLGAWTAAGPSEAEQISIAPNPGGESETVTVRIKPALGAPGHDRKFVNLKVTSP